MHIYCNNYDFRMLDVNEMCIMMSKFIILHFKGTVMFSILMMREWPSGKVSVTVGIMTLASTVFKMFPN